MQPFYFVKNATQKKRIRVNQWLLLTVISLCLLTAIFAGISWIDYTYLATLRDQQGILSSELKNYDALLHQAREQKTAHQNLYNHLNGNQSNPVDLLKQLNKLAKNGTTIESLSYSKQGIEIKIGAATSKQLVSFSQSLGACQPCKGVAITALECADKNRMVALLKKQSDL
jgi:Tfp pilus assembly protein PilN